MNGRFIIRLYLTSAQPLSANPDYAFAFFGFLKQNYELVFSTLEI
jgi:hypothetical protein